MSAGAKLCGKSLGFGTLAAGIAGSLVGIVLTAGWEGSTFIVTGVLVGGLASLFVGWLMAWNATALRASGQTVPMSSAWGSVTGLVLGASIAPLLCASVGLYTGGLAHFGLGLVNGCLFIGPVAGIVGWQVAFWTPTFLSMRS